MAALPAGAAAVDRGAVGQISAGREINADAAGAAAVPEISPGDHTIVQEADPGRRPEHGGRPGQRRLDRSAGGDRQWAGIAATAKRDGLPDLAGNGAAGHANVPCPTSTTATRSAAELKGGRNRPCYAAVAAGQVIENIHAPTSEAATGAAIAIASAHRPGRGSRGVSPGMAAEDPRAERRRARIGNRTGRCGRFTPVRAAIRPRAEHNLFAEMILSSCRPALI